MSQERAASRSDLAESFGAEIGGLYHQARQAQQRARALVEQSRRLRLLRRQGPVSISRKQLMEFSPYARLLAQMETLPVVEQAKGILMAQARIGEAEAFEVLRRASQRSNTPVRELAARIIASAARGV